MGGIVSDLFGGGGPSQPNVQVYQPTGTSTADNNLQALLSQNFNSVSGANNPYAAYSPQFANLFNSVYNSPYASGYQNSANNAGAGYTTTGTNALNNSTALSSQVNPLLTGANSVMNTAFDPQNALYAQTLQKVNDSANVANSQYGLTGQQAAGNVATADSNFNIDWQNNELQRQLQGLYGATSATTGAGVAGLNAGNLGNTGAGSITTGGATPYGANIGIDGNQQTALEDYITSLLGPTTSSQGTVTNLENYLNTGISASEGGAAAALGDYNAQLTNSANLGSGLGSLLGLGGNGSSSSSGGSGLLSSLSALFSSSGGSSSAADALPWLADAAAAA